MRHGPSRLLALSWRERWLFAQSLLLLPMAAIALRVVPFGHVRRFIDRSGSASLVIDRSKADRIAHMVAAASVYSPYRATCLPQSLVLMLLLHRNGLAGDLQFGVATTPRTLPAHCWVEVNGEPLIDSTAVYQQFATLKK